MQVLDWPRCSVAAALLFDRSQLSSFLSFFLRSRHQFSRSRNHMSVPLHAIQHIRRMRGGSQAHLLRASDGAYYVTKFKNNPQHLRVLANEMFASRLGQWLGLPVP